MMESTSKYFDVFLREARDDFERDDDKTLAKAAEGEASGRASKVARKEVI